MWKLWATWFNVPFGHEQDALTDGQAAAPAQPAAFETKASQQESIDPSRQRGHSGRGRGIEQWFPETELRQG